MSTTSVSVDPLITELAGRARDLMERNIAQLPFDKTHLGGACGFASFILARALKAAGKRARLALGGWKYRTHAWVEVDTEPECDDPLIVDITFTQFGEGEAFPRVLTVPASESTGHVGEFDERDAEHDLAGWMEFGPFHETTVPIANIILSDLGAPPIL